MLVPLMLRVFTLAPEQEKEIRIGDGMRRRVPLTALIDPSLLLILR